MLRLAPSISAVLSVQTWNLGSQKIVRLQLRSEGDSAAESCSYFPQCSDMQTAAGYQRTQSEHILASNPWLSSKSIASAFVLWTAFLCIVMARLRIFTIVVSVFNYLCMWFSCHSVTTNAFIRSSFMPYLYTSGGSVSVQFGTCYALQRLYSWSVREYNFSILLNYVWNICHFLTENDDHWWVSRV
jgi:hypothetical protein